MGHRSASRLAHRAGAGGAGRFRCRPRRLPDGRIELEAPPAVRRPPDRPSDRIGQRRGRKLLQPGILAEGPLGGGGQIREPLGDAGRVHRHARRAARIDVGPDVVEDERAEPLGRRGREGESDETAQRGAEDVDGVEPERVQEREHVRHVLRDQVGSRRPLALPPTAEIERQAAMALAQPRRDRIERVALLREPVQKEDGLRPGRSVRLGRPVLKVEPDPVDAAPFVDILRAQDAEGVGSCRSGRELGTVGRRESRPPVRSSARPRSAGPLTWDPWYPIRIRRGWMRVPGASPRRAGPSRRPA
jgi:hypothetical protein